MQINGVWSFWLGQHQLGLVIFALLARRSTDVGTVFGQIKHNKRFRRFGLRGKRKSRRNGADLHSA
ncbi:MAG TPA: hypothetical protein VF932_01480 [Anaerolineae bacterium]